MRIKSIISTILFGILTSASIYSQDFSGYWDGNATWGTKKFTMSLEVTQDGKKLTGIATTSNINNDNFIKYYIFGEVVEGIGFARGVKLIDKKGFTHCMPGLALSISATDPNKMMGKWKANTGSNSCRVPGSGGIILTRKSPATNTNTDVSRVLAIAEDDKRGNALTSELQKQKYHGLFIAVEDYTDESVIDLKQPVSDAYALMSALKAKYSFEQEDVIFLKNPDRSTIIETFDKLTKNVGENDNFLIFYAGHGIWDEDIEQGYWLPSDAKKSSKAAWLSNGTIRDYIRAIDSKHTLLITDACFSGGILKTREAFTASKAMLEMYKLPSRKAMTSGALKTVPDKSVFIEYLVKALEYNTQPLVSADQLFANFKYNVINNSPNGQVPQYGVISQADDEGGEFIFLRK